jgi:phage host-nuclease inhibitor protein Gam
MKITSWDDVEQALRTKGETMGLLGEIENDLQVRTNALRAKAVEASDPLGKRLADLDEAIEQYCTEHIDELDPGARSRKLTCGVVGWEKSKPALKIRNLKKAMEKLLEVKKWAELYTRSNPEPNREALKMAPAEILKAIGARIEQDDNFFARPDTEQIRSTS